MSPAPHRRARVWLEVEFDEAGHPHGLLLDGERVVDFRGWTGFSGALAQVLEDPDHDPSTQQESPR